MKKGLFLPALATRVDGITGVIGKGGIFLLLK